MSHYAQGDMIKMIHSSEDDEGYTNESSLTRTAVSLMSQLNFCDKSYNLFGTSGEAPAIPLGPIFDDTDCQFWAEDELSSSESRQRLSARQKRRRSTSYRNRIVNRGSRSLLQSSSSSSDQKRFKASSVAWGRRKYHNRTINKNKTKYISDAMASKSTTAGTSSKSGNVERLLQLMPHRTDRSDLLNFSLGCAHAKDYRPEDSSEGNNSPDISISTNCQRSRKRSYFNRKRGRIRKQRVLRPSS